MSGWPGGAGAAGVVSVTVVVMVDIVIDRMRRTATSCFFLPFYLAKIVS